MAKPTKRTKKFVKNKLEQTLQQRRVSKKRHAHVREREAKRAAKSGEDAGDDAGEDENDVPDTFEAGEGEAAPRMSVDEFLSGGFREGMDEDEDEDEDDAHDDLEEQDEDELDEDEHVADLRQLAEKDPEFYKYLQENDQDLLKFGQGGDADDADDVDADDAVPTVTKELLRRWQRDLLQHRSLRALRRMLLALRAAVHMGEDEDAFAYRVDDSAVYAKLVVTALKYMPMVLAHHAPYKRGADGRFKVPTHTRKWQMLARSVRSYFMSVVHLLKRSPETDMVYAALTESAKMVPYLHQDRRVTRDYVRALLVHWATGADRVRLAAFSCLYVTTASAVDAEMMDFCMKGAYHALVRHTRITKPHTLEAIALMKNTACELYALHPDAAYQLAFGFIRQLAISLRNCLRLKATEHYQAVLNWPYLHCIDFWSLVLAKTCADDDGAGHMRPLIYPLVQVALGVARLVPTSRYFPLRVHIVRAMLRLMTCTGVYIPLAPVLVEMLDSAEFLRRPRGATLRPLDLETTFRAPAAYVRTQVYADQLADEIGFLLLEFVATQARSIALPELVVPVVVQLRRTLRASKNARLSEALRPLLDRVRANERWIEQRRAQVEFAPAHHAQVDAFLKTETAEAPLAGALRLARKVREQKRRLLAQTAHVVGDDE